MSYQNRRYKVVGKTVAGYIYEKDWKAMEGPEWHKSKADAADYWERQQKKSVADKTMAKARAAKTKSAEIETGIVEA